MPAIVAIGMVLACVAFGALLLYAGWSDCRSAIRSRHWLRADGLVEVAAESVHQICSEGHSDEGRQYRVKFSYLVDGQILTGQWTSLISSHHKFGGCQFTVGQVVDVFYDPKSPSSARLFRGVRLQDLFLVGGGVVFLIASILPILVYLALNRR